MILYYVEEEIKMMILILRKKLLGSAVLPSVIQRKAKLTVAGPREEDMRNSNYQLSLPPGGPYAFASKSSG